MEIAPDVVPGVFHQATRLRFPMLPVMFGPNITGAIASTNALGVGNGDPSQSGALSMVYVDQWWSGFGEAAGKYLRSISFDASGSSATYGASATVQPKSLRALACIKI